MAVRNLWAGDALLVTALPTPCQKTVVVNYLVHDENYSWVTFYNTF